MPSSYSRSGGGDGGTRSVSLRELMDMPFDQLANRVEASAAALGSSSSVSGTSRPALPSLRGAGSSGWGQQQQQQHRASLLPPLALPRARSSSPSLQLPAADEGGLLDLAHWLLGDAAFPFPGPSPLEPNHSSSHHLHHLHHHHHHRWGPGTSPRSATDESRASSPFRRLPLELALALEELQGGTHGRGGGANSRLHTPAGASDGGRSGLLNDYEQLLALDEGRMRRAVRPEVIRGLPTRTAKRSDSAQQCHVCLERFRPGSTSVTRLPCGHSFCSDCIHPWLAANTTCPVCRWAFPEGHTALVAAEATAA
ncbi:hypothetical protein PLESTF_000655300 [Pleodorina starrii]|nr:hypothetical protein PLESTF_000655300 [Pleodorina starrii]